MTAVKKLQEHYYFRPCRKSESRPEEKIRDMKGTPFLPVDSLKGHANRAVRRTSPGFTLAETLVTVLLLLMVSSIVAAGIPVARNVYERVLVSANAEVLLSTSVSALRNELGTARSISVADGKSISYYSSDTGSYSRIYPDENNDEKPGVILLQEYLGLPQEEGEPAAGQAAPAPRQLITDAAATGDLYITYDSASVTEDGIVEIRGLRVRRRSEADKPVTDAELLSIRAFNM